MKQPLARPILVSGAHRTGTTWVGSMLAADARLTYISEPLNVLHHPGVLAVRTAHWYTYICRDNEADFLDAFRDLLAFRYHLWAAIGSIRSAIDILRIGRDMGTFVAGRLARCRPLLKDPFAIFSLAWFAERLNCQILVTVRHPAAFASSLKRLNWPFDFGDLLQQPLLMRDHLADYRGAMQSARTDDVIGQAGLLWAMIYGMIHAIAQANPEIRIVRHEDLSADPVVGFRGLYGQLGLSFTQSVERAILKSSGAGNPIELPHEKKHSVNLDSRASLQNWRRRLSSAEVARIRGLTEHVARLYYPEVDWN